MPKKGEIELTFRYGFLSRRIAVIILHNLRTWTLRDICYCEDGFNHNKFNRINKQKPLIDDGFSNQKSSLEFLYTIMPCKIQSPLECSR